MSIAITLHVLSAIVCVGGMFFAMLILRPASGVLSPRTDCLYGVGASG